MKNKTSKIIVLLITVLFVSTLIFSLFQDINTVSAMETVLSYNTTGGGGCVLTSPSGTYNAYGRKVTGNNGYITRIQVGIVKDSGTPDYLMRAEVYNGTLGVHGQQPLHVSNEIHALPTTGSLELIQFTFDGTYRLLNGLTYWIVINATTVYSGTLGIVIDTTANANNGIYINSRTSFSTSSRDTMYHTLYVDTEPPPTPTPTPTPTPSPVPTAPPTTTLPTTRINKLSVAYGVDWTNPFNVWYEAQHFDMVDMDFNGSRTDIYFDNYNGAKNIKGNNTDMIILGYKDINYLPITSDDYAEALTNPSWFLKTAGGNYIYSNYWSAYVMNISDTGWLTHVKDYVNTKIAQGTGNIYNGVFLDDVWNIYTNYMYGWNGTVASGYYGAYKTNMKTALTYLHTNINGLVIINSDEFTTDEYINLVDGQMLEGFYHPDWLNANENYPIYINAGTDLARKLTLNKYVLCLSGTLGIDDALLTASFNNFVSNSSLNRNLAYFGFNTWDSLDGSKGYYPIMDTDISSQMSYYYTINPLPTYTIWNYITSAHVNQSQNYVYTGTLTSSIVPYGTATYTIYKTPIINGTENNNTIRQEIAVDLGLMTGTPDLTQNLTGSISLNGYGTHTFNILLDYSYGSVCKYIGYKINGTLTSTGETFSSYVIIEASEPTENSLIIVYLTGGTITNQQLTPISFNQIRYETQYNVSGFVYLNGLAYNDSTTITVSSTLISINEISVKNLAFNNPISLTMTEGRFSFLITAQTYNVLPSYQGIQIYQPTLGIYATYWIEFIGTGTSIFPTPYPTSSSSVITPTPTASLDITQWAIMFFLIFMPPLFLAGLLYELASKTTLKINPVIGFFLGLVVMVPIGYLTPYNGAPLVPLWMLFIFVAGLIVSGILLVKNSFLGVTN